MLDPELEIKYEGKLIKNKRADYRTEEAEFRAIKGVIKKIIKTSTCDDCTPATAIKIKFFIARLGDLGIFRLEEELYEEKVMKDHRGKHSSFYTIFSNKGEKKRIQQVSDFICELNEENKEAYVLVDVDKNVTDRPVLSCKTVFVNDQEEPAPIGLNIPSL